MYVPLHDYAKARYMGAKWDAATHTWYVTDNMDPLDGFKPWRAPPPRSPGRASSADAAEPATVGTKRPQDGC